MVVTFSAFETDRARHVVRSVKVRCMSNHGGHEVGKFARWTLLRFNRALVVQVMSNVDDVHGGFSSGTGLTVAATDGDQRAFAETQIKAVMQSAFQNGGKPTIALCPPSQKVNFSAFAGIAVNRIDNAPAKSSESQLAIIGAADVYKSDFGNLTVIPNPQMVSRTRSVHIITPKMMSLAFLRPFERQKLAKTGDAEKRAIVVEYALVVNNEAAHGVVADLS